MGRGAQVGMLVLALSWLWVHPPPVCAQTRAGDSEQIEEGSTDVDWPSHGGTTFAWRYSALNQIDISNVANLVPVWSFQTGDYQNGLESTPIVVDGVIYLAAVDDVFALDGASGDLIWQYKYNPLPSRTTGRNFGVAVGDGKVFLGTHDDHVVALDQKTGKEIWKVAEADGSSCGRCGIQAAPLVVKDKVIVGSGGSPGRLTAFDTKTGHMAWRFYAIPKPGEPGHETWPNDDSWKRGGINLWQTGSYDRALNLVYWGTGDCCGNASRGDIRFSNLYEDSILALDADTGKLRWYYQEVPHDTWDFDANWELLLIDRPMDGRMRKLLIQFSKAGYTFILDRETGELLGVYPYAKIINWVNSINAKGELVGRNDPPLGKTTKICPGEGGAKSFNQVAYSPRTQLAYLPAMELCSDLTLSATANVPPTMVLTAPPNGPAYSHLDALDPVTGKVQWSYPYQYAIWESILATAGDLIFAGDPQGHFFALDARNGTKLWSFQTGSGNRGSPVTYMAHGRQYIAAPTGSGAIDILYYGGVWPEAGKWRLGSTLFVFALPK